MKMRNRITALFTAFCLSCSINMMTVSAAGEKLDFSISAPAVVSYAKKTATDGTETIKVSINVTSNPGVQSWVLFLDYDETVMEYYNIEGGAFSGIAAGDDGSKVIINDFEMTNVSSTGPAAEVTFRLKSGLTSREFAPFRLDLSTDTGNFFDYDGNAVSCSVSGASAPCRLETMVTESSVRVNVNSYSSASALSPAGGTVRASFINSEGTAVKTVSSTTGVIDTVLPVGTYDIVIDGELDDNGRKVSYIPARVKGYKVDKTAGTVTQTLGRYGDVNSDGSIDIFDVALLQQKLSRWGVSVNETAADVTGDGAMDIFDLALLQQYVSRWNVDLG